MFRIRSRVSTSQFKQFKFNFFVDIKLNCDTVQIPTIGQQLFLITPPETAQTYFSQPSFESETIFYWMRSTKQYTLSEKFTNPHPYSCAMQIELGEFELG